MRYSHKEVINLLFRVARDAQYAFDEGEELDDGSARIDKDLADRLAMSLGMMDDLPDDKPDYTLSGPARAQWALRSFLDIQYAKEAFETWIKTQWGDDVATAEDRLLKFTNGDYINYITQDRWETWQACSKGG